MPKHIALIDLENCPLPVNPFDNHTVDDLQFVAGELKTISANLKFQTFDHAKVLVLSKSTERLLQAYEIKSVLQDCCACHMQLTEVVGKGSNNTKSLFEECQSMDKVIQLSIDKMDASLMEYYHRYPNNKPVAVIRMASGATLVTASYIVTQCYIPEEPSLQKSIVAGMIGLVVATNLSSPISHIFKKVKQCVVGNKKSKIPYHIVAAKKLDLLLSGMAVGENRIVSEAALRGTNSKSKASRKFSVGDIAIL